MREEEVYSSLISDVDESFIDLVVEEQPPTISEVGRYDGTCVSTLDATVAMQHSIAQAVPEYEIPIEEFEALQAELFGTQLKWRFAMETNKEAAPIPACDLTTQALTVQDYAEHIAKNVSKNLPESVKLFPTYGILGPPHTI